MITFIPVGGLANRMRSIASVIALAKDSRADFLKIIWFKDKGLNCSFEDLFLPLNLSGIELKNGSIRDLFLYDRPRKKNFHIPRIFQKKLFHHCLYEKEISKLNRKNFDFIEWVGKNNVYMASHDHFYPSEFRLSDLFQPVGAVQKRINDIYSFFNAYTIGVHIRRTDHIISKSESPTELFIKAMEKEISDNPDVCFYLATDSEEEKERLKKIFADKVITSHKKASRSTLSGMEAAAADMFLLSKTQKIIGSSQSSFSEIAAGLTNIPYIVLRKE
ncbi:MAG: glycosyl transferase [Bacteroides sp.]|nr:glycosyl transferase [Bacteroides sp.]